MIRVTTEHDGTREYPDAARLVFDENGALHIYNADGGPEMSLADGQWQSAERVDDADEEQAKRDARADRMHEIGLRIVARIAAVEGPPMFTTDEIDALYQAAHGTEGTR